MKLNNKGFSLVELMVVVAIIGILASVAIPSVNKYMAKARQSEAKTNLGSLYTAEKAFFVEYNKYHTAFQAVGFAPEGRLRYNVGFGADGGANNAAAADGFTATVNAAFQSLTYCSAGNPGAATCSTLPGATNAAPPALPAALTTGVAPPTFTAGAEAQISTAGQTDRWTIDQIKHLDNAQNGIN